MKQKIKNEINKNNIILSNLKNSLIKDKDNEYEKIKNSLNNEIQITKKENNKNQNILIQIEKLIDKEKLKNKDLNIEKEEKSKNLNDMQNIYNKLIEDKNKNIKENEISKQNIENQNKKNNITESQIISLQKKFEDIKKSNEENKNILLQRINNLKEEENELEIKKSILISLKKEKKKI